MIFSTPLSFSAVSEGLNSVETINNRTCVRNGNRRFQKDLIVWKLAVSCDNPSFSIKFQKDLIVWKLDNEVV